MLDGLFRCPVYPLYYHVFKSLVETHYFIVQCQVSAWQSVTLPPISCKSAQPVPSWVEEPVSPVRLPSSGSGTNNQLFLFRKMKVGCQNWHSTASVYSASGREHDQQQSFMTLLHFRHFPEIPERLVTVTNGLLMQSPQKCHEIGKLCRLPISSHGVFHFSNSPLIRFRISTKIL